MLHFLKKIFSETRIIHKTEKAFTIKYCIENDDELAKLNILQIGNIKDNEGKSIYEDVKVNFHYTFDIQWTILRKHGFFITCNDFINNYKIEENNNEFYILELEKENNTKYFYSNFLVLKKIYKFLDEISEAISDDEYLIFSEKKYLKIPKKFTESDISKNFYTLESQSFENFRNTYEKSSDEIKIIAKNELIEFLYNYKEEIRLVEFFKGFEEYSKRCLVSYEYYYTSYNFNKIKTELDTAVLDFSKSIRSVINDSQNRLITIPAAILLTLLNINIIETFDFKNGVIVVSSITFSYLLNLFILNQFSSLKIIEKNIENYKILYLKNNDKEILNLQDLINQQFVDNDKELIRQRRWLKIINTINWLLPISLLIILYLFTINNITF